MRRQKKDQRHPDSVKMQLTKKQKEWDQLQRQLKGFK